MQTAVFVDVAWLRRRAADQQKVDLSKVGVNAEEIASWSRSIGWMGFRYLRTYLYEAQWPAGHLKHASRQAYLDALADTTGVQLRLGHLMDRRGVNEQKGVDSLLVLDLLTLAQRGAYSAAILITGDRDFVEAVKEVQRLGVYIAVAGPDDWNGVAQELRQTADAYFGFDHVLTAFTNGPRPD